MSARTVLELFCGIGGCAAAIGNRARIVAAVDQNRQALDAYTRNFAHRTWPNTVESFPAAQWHAWGADLWWMSPPCPPFTRRGQRRDVDDPRARPLLTMVERIAEVGPRYLAFENVPGFADSRAHGGLREMLDRSGYDVRETVLCPTELGLPNRRSRFYLVAARGSLEPWPERTGPRRPLAALLDPAPDPGLWCDPVLTTRYRSALNVVDAGDPAACTACFTSAYGRSPVRSGSYLATPTGLRRFSPAEILRLLDFPEEYRMPPGMPPRVAWPLVGNSVSVRAVRWVLSAIPGLGASSAG